MCFSFHRDKRETKINIFIIKTEGQNLEILEVRGCKRSLSTPEKVARLPRNENFTNQNGITQERAGFAWELVVVSLLF